METRSCQNCKEDFAIDENDFLFYKKINVPPPTFCPKCRLQRRLIWRNEHFLFKKKDKETQKEIYSAYPDYSKINIYEHDFWWGDSWDPFAYGFEYNFDENFFSQMRNLMEKVPWCARSIKNSVKSDYCNNITNLKNAYLCFSGKDGENVSYGFCFSGTNNSFDFYQTKDSSFCYETFSVVDSSNVFWSCDCAECRNVWFSRNCRNLSDCFGCVNLNNKKYHIFNEEYSEEEYFNEIARIFDGSYSSLQAALLRVEAFQEKFFVKYMHGRRNTNVSGDYLYACNNVLDSFEVHNVDNARYSEFIRHTKDVYDFTSWGINSELVYESVNCGDSSQYLKFCFECWPGSYNLEYCIDCHSSTNCFGCVGLKKANYCIFNKQYPKERYFELRKMIISHMDEKPYISHDGLIYKYGEYFPVEFSPFKYYDSSMQDYFKKDNIGTESLVEVESRAYSIDILNKDIPEKIGDTSSNIIGKVLECEHLKKCKHRCVGAFRINRDEFDFYKSFNIPVPRTCPNCRFFKRMEKLNPVKLWHRKCMNEGCQNEFETSYAPERSEKVYCESCYQKEVL